MIRGWVSGGQGCYRPYRGRWKASPPIPWQGCLNHRFSVSLFNKTLSLSLSLSSFRGGYVQEVVVLVFAQTLDGAGLAHKVLVIATSKDANEKLSHFLYKCAA